MTTPLPNASACTRFSDAYTASGTAATAIGAVIAGSRYCATSFTRMAVARSTARAHASRSTGSVGGLERLDLGERGPFRVDRQATPVGQHQPELDHLAVHADVRGQHVGRQLGEVLAQQVLAGPALPGAARQDRGEPPNDVALFLIRHAALLVPGAQLLERPPGAVEALPQLL